MKRLLILSLFVLFIPGGIFPGTPRPYKTVSKAVVNGYLQTITTYYTPIVKHKKVAVLKNHYRNGMIYSQEVVYEDRPVVSWKKRAQYDYSPLIK